jgi:hypothetical protein
MTNITVSEIISTFKMLHVWDMFNDFGCGEYLNGNK